MPLARTTVYSIFKNPFYYGEFVYGGIAYKGAYNPMITKDEYDEVQRLLGRKGNPRPSVREFVFSGLIKCGECGFSITAEEKTKYIKSTGVVKRYVYHHCTGRKKNYKCSQKAKSVELGELEEQVQEFLSTITISERMHDWAVKYLSTATNKEIESREFFRENFTKQHAECVKRLDNLLKLKISGDNAGDVLLTNEEFLTQKRAITGEMNSIQNKLKDLDDRQNNWLDLAYKAFDFCKRIKERFATGTLNDKKLILSCLGAAIILKDRQISIQPKGVFSVIQKGVKEVQRLELDGNGLEESKETVLQSVYSSWLPGTGSNRRPIGYTYPYISVRRGLYHFA